MNDNNLRFAWIACLALVALGCDSPTAQISGRAEFADGSPIEGAVRVINFIPAKNAPPEAKSASSQIATDGSFKMMTRKPGDGVFKGPYKVTFMVLKDPKMGQLLVPVRYTLEGETPIEVEVTGNQDDLLFQLENL
jgi:hypothetical protein